MSDKETHVAADAEPTNNHTHLTTDGNLSSTAPTERSLDDAEKDVNAGEVHAPSTAPTENGLENEAERDVTMEKAGESAAAQDPSQEANHPVGLKLALITLSLMLAVFCVALDNTIIAVAIPRITDQFHALNDVGWYASSYLLTTCSFQLIFGKFYALFNVKWVFLFALFLFELGSLICGVAPNSTALIVGRAVAGLGSAGIFTGALVTIAYTTPLEKRPMFFGFIGGMYGIASVAGPLMGGAFTSNVTWRWCFYINLPIGAITALGLLFLLKLPKKTAKKSDESWFVMAKRLDPVGTLIFVPCIVCLLLALQWGGTTYAWSNGRIIALFIIFALLLITFISIQAYLKGDEATVPTRVLTSQRTIGYASFFGMCIGASFFIQIYFIPIWFQAILDVSPVKSGIYSLPLIMANVIAIVVSGGIVTKMGYYAPFFILSTVVMSIGAGLIYTFTVHTGQAKWVGYTFLYGLGVGFGFQQGGVAAQAVLPFKDVSIGTAFVLFLQLLGGSLFVSVAQNLFTNHLIAGIGNLGIANLDPQATVNAGATNIRHLVSVADLPAVLVAYNDALRQTFQLAMIMSCLSIFGAIGVEWRSVKGQNIAAAAA